MRSAVNLATHLVFVCGISLCGILAGGVFACGAARADTVTVTSSRDTTLFAEDGTRSNGAGSYVFTGTSDSGAARRALVYFDLTRAIPPGSTVTAVSLRMHQSRTRAGDRDARVHRVLAGWGEAGSNAPGEEGNGAVALPGDATWTHRISPATAWASEGGDFVSPASAVAVAGADGTDTTWESATLIADVQRWLDTPADNFGWIVIGDETEARTAKRFDAHELADAARRPALTVTFTAPGPTGACCSLDGTCGVALDPGSACSGVYQGTGTSCLPNPCPPPAGACCMPNASATCSMQTELDCASMGGAFGGPLTSCEPNDCPVVLTPFVDPLPIPRAVVPTSGTAGGAASYSIAIREIRQRLHRDLPDTTVWGYDDGMGASYPGPTLEARTNEPVNVTFTNDLRDSTTGAPRTTHYFDVDHCVHGAHDSTPRTVVHLHGGHVSAADDGYPEDAQAPGESVTYSYPNWQPAATLWYHDHALGITRLNVYMGLAGLYVVRDGVEDALGLPSGEHEIPLAIQDRTFHADGTLSYPSAWMEHTFGDTMLVNGRVWPYLEVDRGRYRFRMLNGCNARTLTLYLSNAAPMSVIGTDGGLLPAPISRREITLAPGERADVIIDFSAFAPGTQITLGNSAPAPYPGTVDVGVLPNVMRFVVTDQAGHTAPIPTELRPLAPIMESEAVLTRDFRLAKGASTECGGSNVWLINDLGWDDITERPRLGDTEIWRFINPSGVAHPMHLHMAMFQVLDRQQFEMRAGEVVPIGTRFPPSAWEQGWKDTVQVSPGEIVRVIVRFEDFAGRFPYHCHVLEHEDHEMMRQFETLTQCGDGFRGLPGEECDDGNTQDGDGCTSTCRLEVPDSGLPDGGGDGGVPMDGAADAGPGAMSGGCGCRTSAAPITTGAWALLAIPILARRSRARRHRNRSPHC